MTDDEDLAAYIRQLVANETPESERLEFSVGKNKDVGKPVCALANHEGGRVILGVSTTKKEDGVDYATGLPGCKTNASDLRQSLADQLSPSAPCAVQDVQIGEKSFVVVDVEAGFDRPYAVNGTFWTRTPHNDVAIPYSLLTSMFAERLDVESRDQPTALAEAHNGFGRMGDVRVVAFPIAHARRGRIDLRTHAPEIEHASNSDLIAMWTTMIKGGFGVTRRRWNAFGLTLELPQSEGWLSDAGTAAWRSALFVGRRGVCAVELHGINDQGSSPHLDIFGVSKFLLEASRLLAKVGQVVGAGEGLHVALVFQNAPSRLMVRRRLGDNRFEHPRYSETSSRTPEVVSLPPCSKWSELADYTVESISGALDDVCQCYGLEGMPRDLEVS